MSTLTITQLAPILAAARVNTIHEPTWLYVLNFWDSRTMGTRYALAPDVSPIDVTETLQFYAEHNPDGHVPPQWARVPAVQLNPVPAAPSRLRMRAGDEVMEIDVVAALELAQALPYMLRELAAPELVVDRDAGTSTCPHCENTVALDTYPAVREIDIDMRWNEGTLRDDEGLVLDISQSDMEHTTIAHICDNCSKPVTLPAGTESNWS